MTPFTETATDFFLTADAGLAAYLCLLGYDHPTCQKRGREVKFVFRGTVQVDVLRFCNAEPAYIVPTALIKKYKQLIGEALLAPLEMSAAVFES